MEYTNSTGLMDGTGHITADLYELFKTSEVLGVFANLIAYWPVVEPHADQGKDTCTPPHTHARTTPAKVFLQNMLWKLYFSTQKKFKSMLELENKYCIMPQPILHSGCTPDICCFCAQELCK